MEEEEETRGWALASSTTELWIHVFAQLLCPLNGSPVVANYGFKMCSPSTYIFREVKFTY
jgi:hypothetical protein